VKKKRKWLRRALVALVLLLAASEAFSLSLRTARARRYLTARLEAAFGRPVEVGTFAFSLLDGFRIQANSITVGEDPRFGYEYFLRADRLTAGPRWSSLVRGRFDFGTLSFSRPSLNLVRSAGGRWNLESWLPPPASAASAGASAGPVVAPPELRLARIQVDNGRINFQRGVDKHPFALLDVKGELMQEAAGRWRIDLAMHPARAGVILQEAGTLRLRGRIAGTSARLQPADLQLLWEDASLADALRLARGTDSGVRGRVTLDLSVSSGGAGPPAGWSFAGTARFAGVHRWDLPPRANDPALLVVAEAHWQPGTAAVEISKCLFAAPRSNGGGVGRIEWAHGFDLQSNVLFDWVSFSDLLAWYRAFRPGVRDDLTAEGGLDLNLTLSGWPPTLHDGTLKSSGAEFRSPALRAPLRLSRVAARVRDGVFAFEPATLSYAAGPPAKTGTAPRSGDLLRLEGELGRGNLSRPQVTRTAMREQAPWSYRLKLSAQTEQAQDLVGLAGAFGLPLYRGWNLEGVVGGQLEWRGTLRPFTSAALGVMDLHGLRIRSIFLNQPLLVSSARIELQPAEKRVTLSEAQGFGARWKGSLRLRAGAPWEFDLNASRLDAAELDRWLGPRARPTFLERVMPFQGGSATVPAEAAGFEALERFQARGRLNVEELAVAPLVARRVRSDVEIHGREITLTRAEADFFGGRLKGSFDARVSAEPSYHLKAQFERVKLGALADATATLRGRWAGEASGQIEITAGGIGREKLLASLEGSGTLSARDLEFTGVDLSADAADSAAPRAKSRFASAKARFSLSRAVVWLEELRLEDHAGGLEGEGSVSFSRALEVRLRPVTRANGPPDAGAAKTARITGSLDAMKLSRAQPPKR
jgi:hypothetical protein